MPSVTKTELFENVRHHGRNLSVDRKKQIAKILKDDDVTIIDGNSLFAFSSNPNLK